MVVSVHGAFWECFFFSGSRVRIVHGIFRYLKSTPDLEVLDTNHFKGICECRHSVWNGSWLIWEDCMVMGITFSLGGLF